MLSPLALIDLFHPLTGTCHVTALWCGLFLVVCFLVLCVCVLFVFGVFCVVFVSLFFWCFVFFPWMSVTVHRTMYRSSTSLLLRPLQRRPLRELINQLIPAATCS